MRVTWSPVRTPPGVSTPPPGPPAAPPPGPGRSCPPAPAPAPPARGTDTWSMRITDAAGTTQPGLTVGVLPFMPDHGHGTSVNASVTANPDGTYTVAPLYFFMPGVWRISFWIGPNQADVGEVFFCVPPS